jgi:hypothetical protein
MTRAGGRTAKAEREQEQLWRVKEGRERDREHEEQRKEQKKHRSTR